MLTELLSPELGGVPDGGWTDREIKIFIRRCAALENERLNAMDAENLAQSMLYRDRPGSADDRRICLECKALVDRVCTLARKIGLRDGFRPLRTILQRCDAFTMRGKA